MRNDLDKPVEIRTRILPKGRMVEKIAKSISRAPGRNQAPYLQTIVLATITDAPHLIAASSTEQFTLIVVDFNMYDKMAISMSYEGGTLIVSVDPNDFVAKQI